VVLIAFLSSLAIVVLATIVCIVRGVRFWRRFKRTSRAFSAEIALFEERSARTERLLADTDRASDELEAALERLRASRARLQLLLASVERAKQRIGWLRAFLPAR
jgi:hypothetical protein